MGFFHFWGSIPPAPNFAEIHARGGGGRLTVVSRDLIPSRGGHFSTAKRESRPRQSGLPSPKAVPRRAAGGRLGGGATSAGFRRGLAGGFSAALRGKTAGLAALRRGKLAGFERKSRTRWALPGPGVCAGAGFRTRTGGFFRRAGRQTGGSWAKTGRSGGQKGAGCGAWGRKSPLFAPNEAGVWGFGGRNWRRKLAACVGFSGS
nr:MAG TPA: hypothetical protein [Caudoviricetes sp.]